MVDVNGPNPPAENSPQLPEQQPRWSEPTFRWGLIVGSGLLVLGLGALSLHIGVYIVSLLVICSGLGIIFGAFGSLAVLQYKGAVIAGVATIAICLLYLVVQLGEGLVRIRLTGDVKGTKVFLQGDEPYAVADQGKFFEFFVVDQNIASESLALSISLPSVTNADGTITPGGEVNFDCIPAASVRPFVGSGDILQWRFDAKASPRKITGLRGTRGFATEGGCPENDAIDVAAGEIRLPGLVSEAQAQAGNIDDLLADLESDSATVRRGARDALAGIGLAAVRPMMNHWSRNPKSYRVQLGVSVALTQFLRVSKDMRKQVSAALSDADFGFLTDATNNRDRMLRIYATEFLYDLGDVRILGEAKKRFSTATDDGKYNLLVALSGAIPDLDAAQRAELRQSLQAWSQSVGSKTQEKIGKMIASL